MTASENMRHKQVISFFFYADTELNLTEMYSFIFFNKRH